MPSQKRPLEDTTPPHSPPPPLDEEEKVRDAVENSENRSREQAKSDSDSDASSYSSGGEKDEFVLVKLAEIRKEVQCPICLGIIRKTRTVMECLHRFCRECIDKSMRLGNNECPACRTHCASRRSLRDDPNYDSLIAALYPDIDKYEEEELGFHEEEKARNKQIQASIAQTYRRQAEALGKKRTSARVAAAAFGRRHGNYRNSRGRRNHRVVDHVESDEEEGANGHEGSKDSSSADEHSAEMKSKRYKRRGARDSHPSSGTNAEGVCDINDSEANRELLGVSSGFVGNLEILSWGRAGMRSNNRHGALHWGAGKNPRLSKIMDRLHNASEIDEFKTNLTLASLHEGKIPSLKRPYLGCIPTTSVGHLRQYVALQTSTDASEIEILLVKNISPGHNSSSFETEPSVLNPCSNDLLLLDENQTLEDIQANITEQNLVLAYRRKARG